MTKEINIGSVPVKFAGTAATTYRYKQIFKRDLLKAFMEKGQDIDTEMVTELAFIMKCQADGLTNEQFNQISFEDYVSWLDTIDFVPLMEAAPKIISLWADTSKLSVKAKKK